MARDTLAPADVGLAVGYAISITQTLNWWVRMQSEVETHIVSVQRVEEYSEVEQEAPTTSEDPSKTPPASWPSTGTIKFDSYSARYRKGLDLVLKDINVTVNASENVGIVGRTGAGKSTITLGMFRLIEPAGGKITIDGRDITGMGLHELRRKLTIIPQDPVLWTGTIRYNLDPTGEADDVMIWNALEHSHLKSFVETLKSGKENEIKGLETDVQEGGENFSVGQRQLFCLARALLRNSKILIMDEATAAIDPATDKLIQDTIRSKFADCTVLTIAHRLNTIIDYDKIMVLDKGEIAQYGPPGDLRAEKDGIFASLCREAKI